MHPRRTAFLLLNVLGGGAVLGSYVLWLSNPSHRPDVLWGRIGPTGQFLYTVSMFTAAAGYFAFFGYLMRAELDRLAADDLAHLFTLFALILFPSALWMPLTFEYLDASTAARWWAMRGVLGVVGAASAGLLLFVARRPHPTATRWRLAALVGATAFTFQTGVLDALVWPLFFPR